MRIDRVAGAGMLAAGLAAGLAVARNPIDVSTSGRPLPAVPTGTVSEARAFAAPGLQAGLAGQNLNLDRLAGGAYEHSVLLYMPHSTAETVVLEAQLLDRNGRPLEVTLENGEHPNVRTWRIPAGPYERVFFRIKPRSARTAGSELSALDAVWAVLRSSPMSYGDWKDLLPARGRLVLTRLPETAETRAGGKTAVTGGAAAGEHSGSDTPPVRTAWELTLSPPLPSEMDTGVLLASLAMVAAVTLLAAIIIFRSEESSLRAPIEGVSFDFGNSWGTNVAVGTAILNLLTGGAVLSREQYSSNSTTYLLLASLLALFVPLGATLYGLIRPGGSADRRGYTGGYLLSSAVVLWGAFGQLLLLGMILKEMELARVLAPIPAHLLIWMSKGLILIVIVYAILTAKRIARKVPKTAAQTAVTLPMI